MDADLRVGEAREERRRCPLCHDALPPAAPTRTCAACGTAYHEACLGELGGCASEGCRERRERHDDPKAAPAPGQVRSLAAVAASLVVVGVVVAGTVETALGQHSPYVGIAVVVGGCLAAALGAAFTFQAVAPPPGERPPWAR